MNERDTDTAAGFIQCRSRIYRMQAKQTVVSLLRRHTAVLEAAIRECPEVTGCGSISDGNMNDALTAIDWELNYERCCIIETAFFLAMLLFRLDLRAK